MKWSELLASVSADLGEAGDADAAISAKRIVEHASGYSGASWIECVDEPVTKSSVAAVDAMVARRKTGEPIQYVVGEWSFRNIDLFLDRRVLIPRPETEQVVGWALEELVRLPTDYPLVADLGTGSGAIGLSIAAEFPTSQVIITDNSADALAVAGANLAGLGRAATRVSVTKGSWFDALDQSLRGGLDMVVSNPPYCAPDDEFGPSVVEFEPWEALVSEPSGVEDLELIVSQSPAWLKDDGVLVLEMAPSQVSRIANLANEHFERVETKTDFADRLRCVIASGVSRI